VNHFQGRVSCPYGQLGSADRSYSTPMGAGPGFQCDGKHGAPNTTTDQCCVPGVDQPVISDADAQMGNCANNVCTSVPPGTSKSTVQPNCTDRTADKAVYCSCRCANIDGNTNDGANYCSCPDGFSCTQLVSPIGTANALLTGAYCIKNNTAYNPASACVTCDSTAKNCGGANTAQF
jgi:hypothetical protein